MDGLFFPIFSETGTLRVTGRGGLASALHRRVQEIAKGTRDIYPPAASAEAAQLEGLVEEGENGLTTGRTLEGDREGNGLPGGNDPGEGGTG